MSGIAKPFKSVFGFGRQSAEGNQSSFDPATNELSQMMLRRAKGETPSLAETQTTNALDTNLQNTISAIKSASGVSPALRARMISRAGERQGTSIAKLGGEARLAEQQSTEKNLASLLIGGRGQDQEGFQKEQDRRNMFKDFARGAGQAVGSGGAG